MEKLLAKSWSEVLGREEVGIKDNFFMIGGDSIKAIQVSSRIQRSGYQLEVKDIFLNPTIEELGQEIKKSERTIDQEAVEGEVGLTPIQHHFFETNFKNASHYNQAILLSLPDDCTEKATEAIFTEIQRHHDALRLTFVKNGKCAQYNKGIDMPVALKVYDLSTEEKNDERLETLATEIQKSINLEEGPLMKLGFFRHKSGNQLLIAIHHLAIDGVSWRILIEDIQTLYNQIVKGEELVLPLKTDSYKTWSNGLYQYAKSQDLMSELNHWIPVLNNDYRPIPKDHNIDDNASEFTRGISLELKQEQTEKLLTKVNQAFNTEINDILLAALSQSIQLTFGVDEILVLLEGHGREEVIQDININRTIGWFTSLFPAKLKSYTDTDLLIKSVKEDMRKIPNKGIGYGVLKYLANRNEVKEIDFDMKPQICFNYLGQFDTDFGSSAFTLSDGPVGSLMDTSEQRSIDLDFAFKVMGG